MRAEREQEFQQTHQELKAVNAMAERAQEQLQEQVSDIMKTGHCIIIIQWLLLSYSECFHPVKFFIYLFCDNQ